MQPAMLLSAYCKGVQEGTFAQSNQELQVVLALSGSERAAIVRCDDSDRFFCRESIYACL